MKEAAKEKEELLQEQKVLKDTLYESSRKCKEIQEAQREKENQLHQLSKELKEQELKQAKQETVCIHLFFHLCFDGICWLNSFFQTDEFGGCGVGNGKVDSGGKKEKP